ncbi:MAG: P-II family nitrogen regulator [Nitrososphaerales archaeon]
MKRITLIIKPERLGSIKETLVNAGITETSYFGHRYHSPEGLTMWWGGAVPMVQHYTSWVRLELFVDEVQLEKALRSLAKFVDEDEIKVGIESIFF